MAPLRTRGSVNVRWVSGGLFVLMGVISLLDAENQAIWSLALAGLVLGAIVLGIAVTVYRTWRSEKDDRGP